MQWIIGLIIDAGMSLNFTEIISFKLAMLFVLITSLLSYLFFIISFTLFVSFRWF